VAKLLSGLMAQFRIKRRDSRVEMALPVMLAATEAKGHPVEQQVRTMDISRRGALVQGFRGTIRTGTVVVLSRLHKKQEFRVVWVGGKDIATTGQLGLSAVDPNSSFWDDVLGTKKSPPVEPLRAIAARA
jgi:hypothetical protein